VRRVIRRCSTTFIGLQKETAAGRTLGAGPKRSAVADDTNATFIHGVSLRRALFVAVTIPLAGSPMVVRTRPQAAPRQVERPLWTDTLVVEQLSKSFR